MPGYLILLLNDSLILISKLLKKIKLRQNLQFKLKTGINLVLIIVLLIGLVNINLVFKTNP